MDLWMQLTDCCCPLSIFHTPANISVLKDVLAWFIVPLIAVGRF
jgi:hypothetical protein